MANEARGETTLIENDGRQDIFAGCCQFSNDNWRRIGKYFYCFATMAALGLSMSAIVLANREDTRLNEYDSELNSVKKEVQSC